MTSANSRDLSCRTPRVWAHRERGAHQEGGGLAVTTKNDQKKVDAVSALRPLECGPFLSSRHEEAAGIKVHCPRRPNAGPTLGARRTMNALNARSGVAVDSDSCCSGRSVMLVRDVPIWIPARSAPYGAGLPAPESGLALLRPGRLRGTVRRVVYGSRPLRLSEARMRFWWRLTSARCSSGDQSSTSKSWAKTLVERVPAK